LFYAHELFGSKETLDGFCGGRNFFWHWTVPKGRSGGILLGVNLDYLDIGGIVEGSYYVKFRLRSKKEDFMWVLVAVYGATQPEFKEEFLTELVRAYNVEKLPIMVGGDFIIMRNLVKKKQ